MAAIDKVRLRTPPTPEESERLAKLYISAFADASFHAESGAYGYAFRIKYGFPAESILIANGGVGVKSANEAELLGCRAAMEHIAMLDYADKIIVLQCDNTYAVDIVNIELKKFIKLGARDAYAKHVKGHVAKGKGGSRHYINNVCDVKAKEMMRKFRSSL